MALPTKLCEAFGRLIKSLSENAHQELSHEEIHQTFLNEYVNKQELLSVVGNSFQTVGETVKGEIVVRYQGAEKVYAVEGSGRLDCICNAIRLATDKKFVLDSYVEHALEERSSSKAASYVSVVSDGKTYWGAGIHRDIMTSSVLALVSAVNAMLA